ncbi:MAG: DUF1553 domain-containing protein [Verrucomicrobiales bacterium]
MEISNFRLLGTWLRAFAFSLVALPVTLNAADEAISPQALEFFEAKVRPVLAENCYKCHSVESGKSKGGLLLDTKAGLLKGGDLGPAILPGDSEKSLLIQAIRHTDPTLQMPSKEKKLSSEVIADLENWVKMGAPDPRTGLKATGPTMEELAKTHWAFQPAKKPGLPEVAEKDWVKTPVDAFVLAKQAEQGLKHSPKADKRTLIRRATFDLTGLPPTAQEVENFIKDQSPSAWETVIDRLLSSPRYGEKWARHWLDVARYADTKGYVFEEERRYPYSYTYRDYVIRAFNEDLPFDRFIVEQLAADHLPLGEDKRPLAGMGFLTLGRRFLNNQADIIDDRIDVVTRGLMGLTVTCARCHDHKFDPIPTADYYSLYGVFASSSEPGDKPLLGSAALPKEYPAYVEERKKRTTELETFRETKYAETLAELRNRAGEYLLTSFETSKLDDNSKAEGLARNRKLDIGVVRRWTNYLKEKQKNTNDPIFAPWFELTALPADGFASNAAPIAARVFRNESSNLVNPHVAKAFEGEPPADLKGVADKYGKIFQQIDKAWSEAKKANPSIAKLENEHEETLRQTLFAEGAPANLPTGEIPRLFDVPTAQKNRALQRKVEELDATHPGAPPRAMAMQDNSSPHNPRIFVRGNPRNPGAEVPRQMLSIVSTEHRKPFEKGSGRLELAEAIANKDNPLTARVIVNRVWTQYFGAGIVRTPSDFGVRSDPPTHPELLDYLAVQFMEDGWSIKKLHRAILLSNTYQQTSDDHPELAQKDPMNQYLWRMARKRLEFEPFRDTLLQVSGKLDEKMGGQPVDLTERPYPNRRSVYGFIERQNLPGLFRTFDFASPDTTSPQRFNTTVPQQALFMINSLFIMEQARNLGQAPELTSLKDPSAQVKAFYQRLFQREPGADELMMGVQFLNEQTKRPWFPATKTWFYGYGVLDPDSHRLTSFAEFPHFTGSSWQGGKDLPDKKLGWLLLGNETGHPGQGLSNVVVRRWKAPADMTIKISGAVSHKVDKGDGIRARIIASSIGEVGFWPVYNGRATAEVSSITVKKGDTVDFVVDSNQNLDSDSFHWSPAITRLNHVENVASSWNAREEFSGPTELFDPLRPLEKYAQVLLMANELAFVD